MENKLYRRVKALTIYACVSSVMIVLMAIFLFPGTNRKMDPEEITVKRINVVDEDGTLRMVISNQSRQHPGRIDGYDLPERDRQAGMIFFNSLGDECGGLVFDGNSVEAGLVLSVDQFKDDQVMQLQYMENTGSKRRKYGLQLWDSPRRGTFKERIGMSNDLLALQSQDERVRAYDKLKEDGFLSEERLFVGKMFDSKVGLFIHDDNGLPRIRLYVDEKGNPRFEFLDESGKIIDAASR